jgi:thiamine-phosphate pyrophosphorylase
MLITDDLAGRPDLVQAVVSAMAGGVTAVQLRQPGMDARSLRELALRLLEPVRACGGLLIVNDRVDVALAVDADGVHLKRTSLDVASARDILGPQKVIGVSTHEEQEVEDAFHHGANYAVFGPVFKTPSKEGILSPRGPERYLALARTAAGPVLALGGVNAENLPQLDNGRIPGVAVIRAILDAKDPARAARSLRARIDGLDELS